MLLSHVYCYVIQRSLFFQVFYVLHMEGTFEKFPRWAAVDCTPVEMTHPRVLVRMSAVVQQAGETDSVRAIACRPPLLKEGIYSLHAQSRNSPHRGRKVV